jgi:hypothetical protein
MLCVVIFYLEEGNMNMKRKWTPHIVAVTALIVFMALGLASANTPEAQSSEPKQAAPPPPLKIGSTGPGGGKIFYISEEGFTVKMLNPAENYTAHYLEVMYQYKGGEYYPGTGDMVWASPAFSKTSVYGTEAAIGTGRVNTALILMQDPDAPAAKFCDEFSNNGFDDWFLPSIDEVREIHKNSSALKLEVRWSSSSTQKDNDEIWHFNQMRSGPSGESYPGMGNKHPMAYAIFPVRAF